MGVVGLFDYEFPSVGDIYAWGETGIFDRGDSAKHRCTQKVVDIEAGDSGVGLAEVNRSLCGRDFNRC